MLDAEQVLRLGLARDLRPARACHGDDGTSRWRWDWCASGRVGADAAVTASGRVGSGARQRPPAQLCDASTRGKSLTSPTSILQFTCYERTPPAAPCASRKSRLQAPRRGAQSWGAEEHSSSAYAGLPGFHLEDYHCAKRADAAHARCWRAGVQGRSHDGAGLVCGTSKWRRAVVPPLS